MADRDWELGFGRLPSFSDRLSNLVSITSPKCSRMTIPKSVIIAKLRERNQHRRADFVDRQLPDDVDLAQHGGLLATLHLDPDELVREASS